MFCREQAARYVTRAKDFFDLGINLVAVGNGTPAMASDFASQFELTFPLYTDPSRSLYATLGMKYGVGFKLGTVKHAVRALRQGHVQSKRAGAPRQQGGVVLLDEKGHVMFEHHEDGPGEHLPVEEVLATVGTLVNN